MSPRRLLLAAIRLYQRHVSPRKGFRCAYRVHTGRASCSSLGYRVVRRHGVFTGLGLLHQRTRRCGDVHRRHHPAPVARQRQRGACDAGCDLPGPGCNGPCDVDLRQDGMLHGLCDQVTCCDCSGCDRRSRRDRRRQDR